MKYALSINLHYDSMTENLAVKTMVEVWIKHFFLSIFLILIDKVRLL